ncbi:MAG: TonB-dependent receptor, partial [Gammaproteobacteria bacterium]|nr:TonB-dependent receptor [Gammaproteobacteria bacterium]
DGFFDVERVEVARGPQGTTGGKSALSGSISFHTKKPTDVFDLTAMAEFTDQFTQQYQVAFGGPIGDSDFSYRLRVSSLTGDGQVPNLGPGPDAGEPDQFIWSPQLRWKNDRWDVVARYSSQTDKGTPNVSLPLGAVNTIDEFNSVAGMMPTSINDPICPFNEEQGIHICGRNPYFGSPGIPSTANCDNISRDGSRDANHVICDPDDLKHLIWLDAPLKTDNSADSAGIDVTFNVSNALSANYRFGWREVIQDNVNDSDRTGRTGGGVCPYNHPKVLSGMLQEGQTSRYCALDGGGNGTFASTISNYNFTSDQTSHEISLVSNFDGKFNFHLGATYIDGEEPYDARSQNRGSSANDWRFMDTSVECNANIDALYGAGGSQTNGGSRLVKDLRTSDEAMAVASTSGVWACPGSDELVYISGTGQANFTANLNGQAGNFMGNSEYTSRGIYFNLEYAFNETWKTFGGIRNDVDKKKRATTGVAAANATAFGRLSADPEQACGADEAGDCFGVVRIIMRDGTIEGLEGKQGATWDETTWNVGVEYTPNDNVMYYGRISTGARAGGFFGWSTFSAPWSWEAEKLTNYEVGAKGLYFDNALQLSATYFHQNFDPYWVFARRWKTPDEIAAEPFESPTTNAISGIDGTTIGGIELEGAWRISDSVTLRGFYNWLDSSIGAYEAIYTYDIVGAPPAPWAQIRYTDADGNTISTWIKNQTLEYEGNQLPNQAEHKASLTLAYDTPLPAEWGSLELLTILSYTGKKFVELGNQDAYAIDPFKRWDFRANWRSPDESYSVSLYVQNLLDQAGLQLWSPREGIGAWGTVVEPREVGLNITYRM